MENGYEVFNQDNVRLVNLEENDNWSRTRVNLTKNDEYKFDIIIYATGFDANWFFW